MSSTRLAPVLLAAVVSIASVVAWARDGGEGVQSGGATASDVELAVRVGRLHVGDGSVVEDAVIVTRGRRIVAVESGASFPADRVTHHLPDGEATPGWIDAATRLDLGGGAVEVVEVLTPEARAIDAWEPEADRYAALVRDGVTTIGLVPAPGSLVPGRSATLGLVADGLPTPLERVGAPVFALGGEALRRDRVPATTAGARAVLEAAFDGRAWVTAAEPDPPARDAALAELSALRDQDVLAHVDDAHQAEVLVEVLGRRGLRPTLVGLRGADGQEARIAALGVPCVVTELSPVDAVRLLRLPGRLAERGVPVALSTGAPGRSPHSFRLALALAVAHGLSTEQAVSTVTAAPAQVLGVEDRVGRVAAGLEADLVVFGGAPWEPSSPLRLVVSDGVVVETLERAE